MGKTADLAMVQKTIINTLHKEGKSQKVITERGGCSQSAVSKQVLQSAPWTMGRGDTFGRGDTCHSAHPQFHWFMIQQSLLV